ncbi:glycosyltransferase [Specibacter sp. NPDC078709]|uniref:glycosyltransferase n=1 Tax=Specibacter sp. NPDC078709 TaxID=3154364 RepID=UPI003416AAC8
MVERERLSGLDSRMLVAKSFVTQDFVQELVVERFATDPGMLDFDLRADGLSAHPWIRAADLVHFHNLHGGYVHPYSISSISRMRPTLWTLHDMQALTGRCFQSLGCERWREGCGHCPHPNTPPLAMPDRSAELWHFKKAIYDRSHFTAVTPSAWLEGLARTSLLGGHAIRLIRSGIDTDIFRPGVCIGKSGSSRIRIGIVAERGERSSWKFVQSIEWLLDSLHPSANGFELSLVGIDEDDVSTSDSRLVRIPRLTGDQAMANYYQCLDFYVSLSGAENYPLAVLEAQSTGLPVVAFSVGGTSEIVEHGRTGFVASVQEPDMLVQYCLALINDATLRHRMGVAARERALEIGQIDRAVTEYKELYESLV